MNWNCLLDSACALNSSWAMAVAASTNWAGSECAGEVCEAEGTGQASVVLAPHTLPCTACHLNCPEPSVPFKRSTSAPAPSHLVEQAVEAKVGDLVVFVAQRVAPRCVAEQAAGAKPQRLVRAANLGREAGAFRAGMALETEPGCEDKAVVGCTPQPAISAAAAAAAQQSLQPAAQPALRPGQQAPHPSLPPPRPHQDGACESQVR